MLKFNEEEVEQIRLQNFYRQIVFSFTQFPNGKRKENKDVSTEIERGCA